MICAVVGWRPSPKPPGPSSTRPARSRRSCSDHARQTLSRSPKTIGLLSWSHRRRAAPSLGLETAITPSARSEATSAATLRSSPTEADTTRRVSLGAATPITLAPRARIRSQTPASSSPVVATAIITTRCQNSMEEGRS